MKKWLERIGLGLIVIVLLLSAVTYARFAHWRNEVTKNLARDSKVVQTAKGPIEYAEIGQGPAVLMVHGDPGGYDQIFELLKLDDAEPDRCSALVLEEAITMRREPGKPGFVEAALKNTLGADFSVWLIEDQFAAGLQAKDPEDPKITSIAMAIFNATVPDASRDAGHQNDISEQANISELPLKSIRSSALILQGTADANVPIAHGEFAHAQIAGPQFVQLAGQDHWMVITKHKELGQLIHAFLAQHAAAEK
jgi:hypothetical protein